MKRADVVLLKKALYDAEIIRLKKYDSLPKVEREHTAKYNEKITELLEGLNEKSESGQIALKRKWIVAVAIMIIVTLAVTACAVIEPIRTFIIDFFEGYVTFSGKENKELLNIEEEYEIFYLPKGYEKTNQEDYDVLLRIEYKNADKQIVFLQTLISSSKTLDEEHYTTEIDGKTIFIFTKGKTDFAVWHDENYRYDISYPEELDFSEVEKMIRSVAPIGE